MRLIAIAAWTCLLAGCASALTAEQARDAIVDLARSKPEVFVGRPDADTLASLPLAGSGDGRYTCGAFVIDVSHKRYSASIGADSPELHVYTGEFV